jgi:hypothetical protein
VYVQSRVPAELVDPGHRSSYFGFPLIEGKKSHEIKTCATHTAGVHALKLGVRNSVVDNADAAIAVAIVQAFERVHCARMFRYPSPRIAESPGNRALDIRRSRLHLRG